MSKRTISPLDPALSPLRGEGEERAALRLGVFAKTFVRPTVEATLDAVLKHDLECVQFNFSCAGMSSLPDQIPAGLAERIGEASRKRSIEIAAVSGTFNMIHPDAKQREEGFRGLDAIAGSCRRIGTQVITLCTGTRDSADMWRAHPENNGADAWCNLLTSMTCAIEIAEKHDVLLGVEPELANVINSAGKARQLLDELTSPRVKIVMDGANLLRPPDLPRAKEIWAEAFDLLGEHIALAHAKDMTSDGQFVAAGRGSLQFDLFIKLLQKVNFTGPLILHGLTETEVDASVRFLRERLSA